MALTWLRSWARAKTQSLRRGLRNKVRRPWTFRPRLEPLETRLAPATHTWTGGAGLAIPGVGGFGR